MTKWEAAELVAKVAHHPERTTGSDAFKLMDAMWGLLQLAASGEDIRPLLAKRP